MQTNPKDIELIERFLDNELSEAEHSSFLNRIDHDHEFARLFKIRSVMPSLLKDADNYRKIRKEIKSTLDLQSGKRVFFHNPTQMALAAVILLLIATVVILFVANENGIFPFNKTDNLAEKNDTLIIQKKGGPDFKASDDIFYSPLNGAVFNSSDKIIFKWKPVHDSTLQFLIFFREQTIPVYHKKINPGQDSILLPPGTIKPGEYQWYIADKNSKHSFTIKPAVR
ncbi:MAG: hypothetical protein EOM90_14300 [Alphaproteobacteria bacterium]|nr:hypothetical protein [Alphaproteobacteria bacterium]